jgi:putative Mg2+ transporter-C (MgtC) family protein
MSLVNPISNISDLSILQFILPKVLFSTAVGAIIGISRERQGKPAGIRTNILICVGSCLFTVIAVILAQYDKSTDLSRMISQIISGVGFLGAGTIFKSENKVHGLTSAAFVWVVAALGVLCGLGAYLSSVLLSIGCLFLLWIIGKLDPTKKNN